ncbi:MAG TPA: aminotransferase class I/II-fold pyridoxal phosphate-dependent enzyme [Thermoplasmata archaeon]|nr:aminotransferase class I/II-fold pyridoxal phosphate-dependent enzyme [Thermoplasmata archaeon]
MFPLAAWVWDHRGCRHNLGESGMYPAVAPVRPSARELRAASVPELRRALAASVDVDPGRLFLTHGATEGNGWVSWYVARRRRGASARPRCRVGLPEYPPLVDGARAAGFRTVRAPGATDYAVLSNPRNPEGRALEAAAIDRFAGRARWLLVDETFREFGPSPTYAGAGRRGVFRTGTFTKFFGGDSIRVGFVVAPEEETAAFGRFHDLVVDRIPTYSVAAALATWDRRATIGARVRAIFRANVATLRAALPDVPELAAPVFFDRVPGRSGRALAERCAARSVLVCPGDLFGDPRGVRLGLTRRTFPADLAAYRRVRPAGASRTDA